MKSLLSSVVMLSLCACKDDEFEHHKKDFDRAYAMLAPSYTNMVTRARFAEQIATNHNFDKPIAIKSHTYHSVDGAVRVDEAWAGPTAATDLRPC